MKRNTKPPPLTGHALAFLDNTKEFDIHVKTTMGKAKVLEDGTIIISDKVTTQEERVKVGREAVRLLDLLLDHTDQNIKKEN